MTIYVSVGIGYLESGVTSAAFACSSNGTVIVGYSNLISEGGGNVHAFRWTQAGGMLDLGILSGGSFSQALACSQDGSVIVGFADNSAGKYRAFRWTSGGGMVDLGVPGVQLQSVANGCSADGSVVVGDNGQQQDAWYWTSGGGFVEIGSLGGLTSQALGCSTDGSIIVGLSQTSGGDDHGFSWTSGGGMVDLGVLSGNFSEAQAISLDGTVIVGQSNSEAVTWTDGGDIVSIGFPSFAGSASANGVSSNGTIIVGSTGTANSWIWTESGGFVELPGGLANGVSSNGVVPVGTAAGEAAYWIPFVPPPPGTWVISSSTTSKVMAAGIGDVWMDQSYVDFSDDTVRAKFINPNGTWLYLGYYGETPTGTSPLDYLRVQTGNPPTDILTGYGQGGTQSAWSLLDVGDDPTTGEPYPAMSFDVCPPSNLTQMTITDLNVKFSTATTTDHDVTLRWSDDQGASWNNGLVQTLGLIGEYSTAVQFRRIGMARNRVLELSWSGAMAEALTGVWVQIEVGGT